VREGWSRKVGDNVKALFREGNSSSATGMVSRPVCGGEEESEFKNHEKTPGRGAILILSRKKVGLRLRIMILQDGHFNSNQSL